MLVAYPAQVEWMLRFYEQNPEAQRSGEKTLNFFLVMFNVNYLVHTPEMKKFTDNQNFDYHLRKNDLKWFIEAKIIYKHMIPDKK